MKIPLLVIALLLTAVAAFGAEALPVGVPDVVRLSVTDLTFSYPGDAATPAVTLTVNGALFWDNRTGAAAVGSAYTDQYVFGVFPYTAVWRSSDGAEVTTAYGAPGQVRYSGPDRFSVEGMDFPSTAFFLYADIIFPTQPLEVPPDLACVPAWACMSPPGVFVPGEVPTALDSLGSGVTRVSPTGGTQVITTPEPGTLLLLGVGLGALALRRLRWRA